MLTEEALIVLAALGALGLLVLGTLELLWPSRPKLPPRRDPPPAPTMAPVVEEPAPRRWRSSYPRHAAGARERYLKRVMPTPAVDVSIGTAIQLTLPERAENDSRLLARLQEAKGRHARWDSKQKPVRARRVSEWVC